MKKLFIQIIFSITLCFCLKILFDLNRLNNVNYLNQKSIENKFSTVNINNRIGNTDISNIKNGIITDSIKELNNNISIKSNEINNIETCNINKVSDSLNDVTYINCYIKNNICYLSMEFTVTKNVTYEKIFEGIPIPKNRVWYFSGDGSAGIATTFAIYDDEMYIYYTNASTTQRYDISISYPINN